MTATLTEQIDHWQEACDSAGCGDAVLFERQEDTIRVLLVDASGHGPRAAEIARLFAAIARPALSQEIDAEVFRSWNRRLRRVLRASEFVAVTALEADLRRGACTVWNAGNPAVRRLCRRPLGIEKIEEYGLLLGAFDADSYMAPEPRTIELQTGEFLILHTDGVTDQRRGEEPFGEDRLHSCLVDASMRRVALLDELRRALYVFRQEEAICDDMTAVVIQGPFPLNGATEVPAAVAA